MILREWQRGDPITAERLNEGRRGLSHILADWQHVQDRLAELERRVTQMAALRWFVGLLGNATSDGDNRWVYDFVQAQTDGSGYGTWAELENDGTHAGSDAIVGVCRNLLEEANSSTQVNGTATSSLTGTFAFQPIASGTPVVILPQRVNVGTEAAPDYRVSYWFIPIPNNIDGSC